MKAKYPEGTMSVRSFAKFAGVTDTTVETAIKSGYLEDGAKLFGTIWRIFPEKARQSWSKNFAPSAQSSEALIKFLTIADVAELEPVDETDWSKMSVMEARRRTEIAKARTAQMELDEKLGTLVLRSEVMGALFAFGQSARVELETLPARMVDAIDAATTRHAKVAAATAEIKKALTFLADLESGSVSLKMGRSTGQA